MTFDTSELIEKRNRVGRRRFFNEMSEVVAEECSVCRAIKHKKHFSPSESRCKSCNSSRAKKWGEENKERKKENFRRWYENNREYNRERVRKWRQDNIERVKEYEESYKERKRYLYKKRAQSEEFKLRRLEYNRRHRKENPEWYAKYNRNYRKENPHVSILSDARRRARLRNLPNNLTRDEIDRIYKSFGGACSLSGDKEDIHLDHVIPIASGHGGTIYENMIPLRADLNVSKNNRNIFDWFTDNCKHFGLSQQKFDELIEYLADINEMTVEEYRDYVYWCHDNPRTIDEIKAEDTSDNEAS